MTLKMKHLRVVMVSGTLLIAFLDLAWNSLRTDNGGFPQGFYAKPSRLFPTMFPDSAEKTSSMENVHRARQEQVLRTCQRRPSHFRVSADLSRYFSFSDLHRLVYCSVQKVGCSFWIQVMKILTNQLPKGSLYRDSFYHLTGMKGSNYSFSAKTATERERMLKSYTKFMFVRDPYARLFSAYMDKVFNPSGQLRYILKKYRKFKSKNLTQRLEGDVIRTRNIAKFRDIACFANVSFSMFVETIISQRNLVDPHFTPMFRHCDPCAVSFDYIGKMETFIPDTEYILQKAEVQLSRLSSSKNLIYEGNEVLAIRDFAKGVLFFRRSLAKRCQPTYLCDIYHRIWVTLQTRGLISTDILFPFPEKVCDSSLLTNPIGRLIQAHLHSGKRSERMRQRHMALMEAYYSLSRTTLKKLEAFVKDDCDLFGYDCDVDARFPKGGALLSNHSFFRPFW